MFEYDLYLGGPPDWRCKVPYRQMIKDAFSQLRIYDWEQYKWGDDYQKKNNEALKVSCLMVSMMPDFPMPSIGSEVGYFYSCHQERIEKAKAGFYIGLQNTRSCPENPTGKELMHCIAGIKSRFTAPVYPSILIWPDVCTVDTRRTFGEYALIVSSVEEAIAAVQNNLAAQAQLEAYMQEMREIEYLAADAEAADQKRRKANAEAVRRARDSGTRYRG